MRILLLLSFLLSLSFISCKCKKVVAQTEKGDQEQVNNLEETKDKPTEKLNNGMVNKYWKAVEIMGEEIIMPEGMKQEPFIKLDSKGQLKGSGGCNSFFGDYKLSKNNFIHFGELGMTEMECTFESYDRKLAEVLGNAQQYIIIGEDDMHLVIGKRAPLAKFKAVYFE